MTERAPISQGRNFLAISREWGYAQREQGLQPRDYITVPWSYLRRWSGMPRENLPTSGKARLTFIKYEEDIPGAKRAVVVANGHWGRIDPSLIINYGRTEESH